MKYFSEFLNKKINEEETPPTIFKGKRKDPYQYKIKGERVYYAKKNLGDIQASSPKWIEITKEDQIKKIKDLYYVISQYKSLTPEIKRKIEDLQRILNGARKVMPRLWTLPLVVDGIPGWRTGFSWYMIMIVYPQMENVNDISYYSRESFLAFKDPQNWISASGEPMEIKSALDFFEKFIIDPRWTKEGKVDFDMILDETKKTVDFMTGKLEAGSTVTYLYCTSLIKSIPESIKAELVIIEENCSLKTLPSSTECKTLSVYSSNKSNQFKIPKIKTNAIDINGPVTIAEEWDQIDYLSIKDHYEGIMANPDPLPGSLKNIGSLSINSESITKIPDNLKIGEIMENYRLDPIKPDPIINSIPLEPEELQIIKKKKKPWLKRIFSKEKYEYYYESEDYSIYESFIGDPGNFDIQNSINIKTLPKGLVVLGDFYIGGSGIEFTFKDEEIREVCDIKGRIIRSYTEEDILGEQ
jgi:hypothetical protein